MTYPQYSRQFGSVPNDNLSADADQLIVLGDQGRYDEAQQYVDKPGVCQRALDVLALPACASGQTPDGSCFTAGVLTNDPPTISAKIRSLCPGAGGLSTPAKIALAGGAIIALALVVRYMRKG